jgi:Uma2 family endonuclease
MANTLTAKPTRRVARLPRRMSLEAYLRAEEKALHKHEYHNGIILPMAGAKLQHNLLAQKAATLIDTFLEEQNLPYKVSNSDTKIRIDLFDKIVYPDAVVICETPVFYQNREDIITNPLVVVEVLSKSTERHDQGDKFGWYRSLPSFKEYVLINQDYKRVSVFTRQSDDSWLLRDYDGPEAVAQLYALHGCPLPLQRLYRGLTID